MPPSKKPANWRPPSMRLILPDQEVDMTTIEQGASESVPSTKGKPIESEELKAKRRVLVITEKELTHLTLRCMGNPEIEELARRDHVTTEVARLRAEIQKLEETGFRRKGLSL